MPVTIRELIIRATVEDPASTAARDPGQGERPGAESATPGSKDPHNVVAACVEEVMDRLRELREP